MSNSNATLKVLQSSYPDLFSEGELDLNRLVEKLETTSQAPSEPERYRFAWSGQRQAMSAARVPAGGILVPMRDVSVDFDKAENVVIEGDNLEVLRALRRSYQGRVKMITIDPPYNTGHDFVYPDNFRDGLGAYLEQTGQLDGAGRRRSTNVEVDGRVHSRWLTMMLPRLLLARDLLRDDGAIFVTIDDHECHHLRLLMNEVFGEENFVAQIAWQKRYTRSNNTDRFTSVIDHVLLYQRSEAFEVNLLPRGERDKADFKNPDDDPRGPWKPTSFLNQVPPERRPNMAYDLKNPLTGEVTPAVRKAWRVNQETFGRLQREGRLWWGADGKKPVPQVKTYLAEVRQGLTPTNFWSHQYAGHTDLAHKELKDLFGRKVFDTPKPSRLVRRMCEHATGPDDLVMDFFAGSGSAAQAVLDLNAEDGGQRRFILVQFPEPMEDSDFSNLAEVTMARARRVLEQQQQEGTYMPQAGFRAFRLVSCQKTAALSQVAELAGPSLEEHLEHVAQGLKPDMPAEHLLFQVIAEAGLPLTASVESLSLPSEPAYTVNQGELVVCLGDHVDESTLDAMLAVAKKRLVCLEHAFGTDDALRIRFIRAAEERNLIFESF